MQSDILLDDIESAVYAAAPEAASGMRAALEAVRPHLPPALELVAGPGFRPEDGVQTGDILVRLNPGEPASLVARIVSTPVWQGGFRDGLGDDDLGLPGWVAAVAPVTPRGASLRVSQVLDRLGRIPTSTALFRRRKAERKPPAAA